MLRSKCRAALAVLVLLPACRSASSAAASSAGAPSAGVSPPAEVVPGVEVLLRDSLHLLQGKRVGLITNQSGRDRRGTSTIDLLYRAPGVKLVALFGPEHGLRGAAAPGETVASSTDSATGLPIYSLYGATRAPTPAMLADVDVLVYDIQDVGARIYTYEWTMALAADAAGKAGKRFIVLDRPDPIRGDIVEGGVLEPAFRSFVGQYPVAMRYGLTPGELLRYLVGTKQIDVSYSVVPMLGWHRSMWFDETGIPWVNPSPNLRTVDAEALYPGTVYFEATNLSEGRGTDQPFQLVGAPWLTDAGAIAAELNARGLPGVRFDSTSRTIEKGQKWGGQTIPMLHLTVTDRDALRPTEIGAWMLQTIRAHHPTEWQWRGTWIESLTGSTRLRRAVESGTVAALIPELRRESGEFEEAARKYWLY